MCRDKVCARCPNGLQRYAIMGANIPLAQIVGKDTFRALEPVGHVELVVPRGRAGRYA